MENFNEIMLQIGQSWVLMGMSRMNLVRPPPGFDPAAKYSYKAQYLQQQQQFQIQPEIKVLKTLTNIPCGFFDFDEKCKSLENQNQNLTEKQKKLEKNSAKRPVPSQYSNLLIEIDRFISQSRPENIVSKLMNSQNTNIKNILDEATLWISVCENWCERLQANFPMYRDLVQPLVRGAYEASMGMRIMIESAQAIQNSRISQVVNQIIQPIPEINSQILESVGNEDIENKLRLLLLQLQGLLIRKSSVQQAEQIFEEFVYCWQQAKQDEQDQKKDEGKLFVQKEVKIDEDEATIETDFRSQFPDNLMHFEEFLEIEELQQREDSNQLMHQQEAKKSQPDASSLQFLEGEIAQNLVLIHSQLTSSKIDVNEEIFLESFQSRYKHAGKLLQNYQKQLNLEVLDGFENEGNISAHFLMSLVRHREVCQDGVTLTAETSKILDVNQSCVEEVGLILQPVKALRGRLAELLADWPDNPLLTQLDSICVRLIELPLDSSLKKAMVGMELLLLRAQTWERTAAKFVSLGEHLKNIGGLITRWRQMELKSWKGLLDRTIQDHKKGVGALWFGIYYSVFLQPPDSLQEYFTIIKDFLVTYASIGDYSARLQLLRTISNHQQYSKSPNQFTTLLNNSIEYYSQFEKDVEEYLEAQMAPLRKEIKDFVRLAKWEDRGYYTLQINTEKAQRQLHKLVRKTKEIVRITVMDAMVAPAKSIGINEVQKYVDQSDVEEIQKDGEQSEAVSTTKKATHKKGKIVDFVQPVNMELPGFPKVENLVEDELLCQNVNLKMGLEEVNYLNRTKQLHRKMKKVVGKAVQFEGLQKSSEHVIELAEEIASRAHELSKDEAKGHKARKKKAFVEYRKGLDALGVSKHTSSVPEQERGCVHEWLAYTTLNLQQFQVFKLPTILPIFKDADNLHFKSISALQRLWQVGEQCHDDVRSEISNIKNRCEHLLYIQRCQRKGLSSFLNVFQSLNNVRNQLPQVNEQIVREQKKCQQEIDYYAESFPRLELDCLYAKIEIQNLKFVESVSSEFNKKLKLGDEAVAQLYSSIQQKVQLFTNIKSKLNSVYNSVGLVTEQERDEINSQLNSLKEQINEQFEQLKFSQQQYEVMPTEFQLCVTADSQQLPDLPTYLPALKNLQKQLIKLFNESQMQLTRNQDNQINNLCELGSDLENTIKDTLLWAQNLSNVFEGVDFDEQQQKTLTDTTLMFVKMLGQGSILKITEKLQNGLLKLVNCLDDCSFDDRELMYLNSYLIQVKALIDLVSSACEGIVQQFLVFQRATCKLGYVIISICVSLMCDGFCGPAEEAAGEGEGDGDIFKEEEGVGLGEGQGAKDVSDQIENEDQIQGAKQKDQQQEDEMQEDLGDNDDKGVEMDEDFAGQMYDVPKQEEDKNDDGDDQGEEEERLDQQMGDVGDEADVVDEKLWADDKDEKDETQENKKPQETYEKDAPIQVEDKSNLEYHAGQEEEENADQKVGDTKPESGDLKDEMKEDEQGQEEEEEEGAVNEEIIEDKQFAKPEAPDEEFDLEDQMNLDEVEEEQGDGEGEGEGEGDRMDAEEQKELPQEGQNNQDENGQEQDNAEEEQEEQDDTMDDDGGNKANEVAQTVEDDTEQPPAGEEPQQHEKDMQNNYQNQNEYENVPEIGPRGQASNQLNQPQPVEQKEDGQGDEQEDEEMDVDQGENVQAVEGVDMGENNPGDAVGQNANTKRLTQWNPQISSNDNSIKKQKKSKSLPDVNPSRSLADAIEQWKENLAMKHDVGQAQQQEQQQQKNNEEDAGMEEQNAEEYQFLQDDDIYQKGDTQTIASATKEQAQQQLKGDLNSGEEDKEEGYNSDVVMAEHTDSESSGEDMEEEDLEMTNTKIGQETKSKFSKVSTGKTDIQGDDTTSNSENDNQLDSDMEMDHTENEDEDSPQENEAGQNTIHSYVSYKHGIQDADTDVSEIQNQIQMLTMSDERREELRKQIENYIQNPEKAAEFEVQKGREIWGRCDALTAGLAGELAEQLRLVLEPQMASRLVGDYKSGKRINMKKVIQFIASRFRKDKIWMRRTKPNKRTYQVVLAVDDSRSMTESGCAPYALEALTLICKAMQRLEVGQLGLVSFGGSKGVQLLHSLEQPFTDSLGPSVLGRLGFDQDSTLDKQPMAELMVSLQHLLQQAKQNRSQTRSSVPLHQLVLIIADGRLHERDNLKKMVREMSDVEGAMFVYIVVDNPKESVLDIKQVKFIPGGGISTDPYLDSFPFPYYILLRQISALPRTLAELLQQFFQHAMAQQ